MKSLEVVGHIDIPDAVRNHRFYDEAYALTKLFDKKIRQKTSREPVIGTANTGDVELYGWARNVGKHIDDSGYIYFVALNDGDSLVVSKDVEKEHVIDLPKGAVARMNDLMPHFTFDDKPRVCAFIAMFKKPDDAVAIKKLTAGIAKLEKGDYYGAPRVQSGFRAMMPDECFVASKDYEGTELMLLADAKKKKRLIQTCGLCEEVAVKIDNHWPWYMDMNRCKKHLMKEA